MQCALMRKPSFQASPRVWTPIPKYENKKRTTVKAASFPFRPSGADMNFQEYEREFYFRYAGFAETVKLILEKAIEASDVPRPQSVQCRAKSLESLKDRLEEIGKLDSANIENERKDLAGARVIFYVNTDVERFRNSRLIFETFEIERDAIKIHHPTTENEGRRYRAIHYTVRLKEDRAKLPEYSKFKGMRCEIQIQTILDHAWSETSHGIYKDKPRKGFGNKARESIKTRLDRIMDKHLLPAGYDFSASNMTTSGYSRARSCLTRTS
jgi:ppGpp synthetase/RelA/SpoT-type nucleotidyltranferase